MCDYPKVYHETAVKRTRKPHKCCECRQVIPVGGPCLKGQGIWEDNGPMVFYWCLDCEALRTQAEATLGACEEPIGFGELHEFMRECGG